MNTFPQLVEQARGGKDRPVIFVVSVTAVHPCSTKAGKPLYKRTGAHTDMGC